MLCPTKAQKSQQRVRPGVAQPGRLMLRRGGAGRAEGRREGVCLACRRIRSVKRPVEQQNDPFVGATREVDRFPRVVTRSERHLLGFGGASVAGCGALVSE